MTQNQWEDWLLVLLEVTFVCFSSQEEGEVSMRIFIGLMNCWKVSNVTLKLLFFSCWEEKIVLRITLLYMPASWIYTTDISLKGSSAMKKRKPRRPEKNQGIFYVYVSHQILAFLFIFNIQYCIKSQAGTKNGEFLGIHIGFWCRYCTLICVACVEKY